MFYKQIRKDISKINAVKMEKKLTLSKNIQTYHNYKSKTALQSLKNFTLAKTYQPLLFIPRSTPPNHLRIRQISQITCTMYRCQECCNPSHNLKSNSFWHIVC